MYDRCQGASGGLCNSQVVQLLIAALTTLWPNPTNDHRVAVSDVLRISPFPKSLNVPLLQNFFSSRMCAGVFP